MDNLTYPIMLTDHTDIALNIIVENGENLEKAIMHYYGGISAKMVGNDIGVVTFLITYGDGDLRDVTFYTDDTIIIF